MAMPLPVPGPGAGFTSQERDVLAALMNVIIPEDEDAGGWEGGVARLLDAHADGFMSWSVVPLKAAAAAAEEEALRTSGIGYAELGHIEQSGILHALIELEGEGNQPVPALMGGFDRDDAAPFAALRRVAFEGYYGNTSEPAGWAVAKFRPLPEASPRWIRIRRREYDPTRLPGITT